MSKFLDALKKRFRTPQEAMAALGLDASLLDPDDPSPVIAHDWAIPTLTKETNMNGAEFRLLNAMRTKFRAMGEPMRLLGLDEADLEAASPDDGNEVAQIIAMFRNLSDEDKNTVLSEIAAMAANEPGETAGDRARRRYAMDRGLPYRSARAGSPSAFAQRLTRRIGNGFG